MASNIEENSLYDMLTELKMNEIPEELPAETENIWVKALVRVQKRDTSINYAIALNNGRGGTKIIKDSGRMSTIVKILNIYPLNYLDKRDIPTFNKQADYVMYLTNNGYDEEECKSLISRKDKDGNDKDAETLERDRNEIKQRVIETCIKNKIRG